MAEKKEKQYVSDNARLMAEWNWDKNIEIKPNEIRIGSGKKVWWKCAKGHEWQSTIDKRNNGRNCPYCSNHKVLQGYNDLATVNPILVKEWNYEKNNGLKPVDIVPNSNKKVWWKCNKGHEFQAVIASRNKGGGCPYCSGRYAVAGETDLQTVNPILANEWNYEKNGELKPFNVKSYSHYKVWWKCSKGHEWQAVINSRNSGSGCPICDSERRTSFPEYALVYYLKKYGVEVIHCYKAQGYELDIYIPSAKIAIEYDGGYWHKNRRLKELEKNSKCENDGIKLYRIREGLAPLNDSSIDYVIENNQKELAKVLKEILSRILGNDVDVNLKRDSIDIENLRVRSEKETSLLLVNPVLAGEWNYEKNGNLTPENVTPKSNKKVWWKCNKGHEWLAKINNRSNGRNCPYCSNKRLLRGYNDLSTRIPALAKEWNYKKNGELTPADVMPNTNKTVWWKCNKGHEWAANINNRSQGNGCPYCSNQKVLSGYNDLTKTNTLLAREWNFSRNGSLKPEHCTASSGQKVWWKCSKGHEWLAIIASRNKGHGCPYCAGQKAIKGENDLKTVNSTLASEWNYEKNGAVTPMDVMPNSSKKVWWKCKNGHEWQAVISSRNSGRGCPECAKQKRMKNKDKD